MKSLKEIRKHRLTLVQIGIACAKECVNRPPALYCQMCKTAETQEKILAWVSEDKSIFEEHQESLKKITMI